jgi:tetratricopeptide (TPR) repeat protein
MTQLSYQNKDYPKAAQYGNKYLELNPGDQDIGVLVATSYYLQNDFAAARTASQKLIASATPKPTEQMLQLQLRTNVELQDRAGTMKSLEDMIRYYPQPKYWEDLLNQQLFQTNGERDLRTLFRLMVDTGTMDKGEEFTEAASVMNAGGFPTEAKTLLEKGRAANAYQGESRRAPTRSSSAQTRAAEDRKEVPGAPAALASAKTGTQAVATGKLYFSVGDYAKAADAIKQGLARRAA